MFDVGVPKASVVRDTITSVMSFIFARPLGGFVWGFVWMRENRGFNSEEGWCAFYIARMIKVYGLRQMSGTRGLGTMHEGESKLEEPRVGFWILEAKW
jgi:hypothetical protein